MTPLFVSLEREIDRLAAVYLPVSDQVLPTPEEQERARAFVLLSHAEIEWYIEHAAEAYSASLRDAAARGYFNFSSLALIAFSEEKFTFGDSLGGKRDGRTIGTIFGKLHANLKIIIDSNNGINEKSLAKFLGPLGISGRIDSNWMNDLGGYASMRGRFAHMSGPDSAQVIATINPVDVKILCDRIVNGVNGVVGEKISSLLDLDNAFEQWKNDLAAIVRGSRVNFIRRLFGAKA